MRISQSSLCRPRLSIRSVPRRIVVAIPARPSQLVSACELEAERSRWAGILQRVIKTGASFGTGARRKKDMPHSGSKALQ
jgi:hypothetical protein